MMFFHDLQETDSKVSPLAMLTQACNKIESNMLGSSLVKPGKPSPGLSRDSPKRSRTEFSSDEDGTNTPPSNKQPRIASNSAPHHSEVKVSQPLASSEKRKTPERRPSSTSVSSMSSTSPSAASIAASRASIYPPTAPHPSLGGHYPSLVPPGYLPPHLAAAMASTHGPGPCTNPMCTDITCPTGAARASLLMGVPPPSAASLSLLNLMHQPPAGSTSIAPPTSTSAPGLPPTQPHVCSWVSNGEFCGRRFSSGEDLMGHLRTHTAASAVASTAASMTSSTSTSTPSSTSLAVIQAAQAQALASTPVTSTTSSTSALAYLQAQAAKLASSAPHHIPSTVAPPTSTTAPDLAAAAAARYHASFAALARPGLPHHPGHFGLPPSAVVPGAHSLPPTVHAIPPHLASLYGLGNPYSLPMIYPMP